jgi:hypothetical protein
VGSDCEGSAVEIGVAEEVGERLAGGAAFAQNLYKFIEVKWYFLFGMGVEMGAVAAGDVGEDLLVVVVANWIRIGWPARVHGG